MTDWAEDAARKTLQQDAIRDHNVDKANREAKIKTEVGAKIFKELQDWITKEIEKYNGLVPPADALSIAFNKESQPQPLFSERIIVGRKDGRKGPLRITFNATTGIIHYECGAGQANFNLKIADDGSAHFETPYHKAKTSEEIGAEALSKFQDSTF
jgi:hypothetical protein